MPKITPRGSSDPIPATRLSTADRLRDAVYTGYLAIPSRLYNRLADDYMQSCKDRRVPFIVVTLRSKATGIELDMRPTHSKLAPTALSIVNALLSEHANTPPYGDLDRQWFSAQVDIYHAEFVAERLHAVLEQCKPVQS